MSNKNNSATVARARLCAGRCGRPPTVMSGGRNYCAACYTRARTRLIKHVR